MADDTRTLTQVATEVHARAERYLQTFALKGSPENYRAAVRQVLDADSALRESYLGLPKRTRPGGLGDLAALQAKYAAVPGVAAARTAPALVDAVVRRILFDNPGQEYGAVLRALLEKDPDLKAAYAR